MARITDYALAIQLIDACIIRIANAIEQWDASAPRHSRQTLLDDVCEDVLHLSDMREHLDREQQWFESFAREWWHERYCTAYYR